MMKVKHKARLVGYLKDVDRVNHSGHRQVAELVVSYFQIFLGKVDGDVVSCPFLEELLPTVSEADAEYLTREVTDEKIYKAILLTRDDKSPGPDGYTFFSSQCGIS